MRSPRTPRKEGKRGREGGRGRTLAAALPQEEISAMIITKGRERERKREEALLRLGSVGPHTTGVGRGSRSEENNFIISPTDATGFVCSLAAGSYPTHFFPLTRARQKTLHRVIVSRCLSSSALCGRWGTDRSLLCLRISCDWVEYLTSGALAVAGFPFSPSAGRPSDGSSARRAIDYIFPVEIETSFRLSIIDSSPFSSEIELQGERGYLLLKTQDDLGLSVILPPDIYTTRCGRAASRSLSLSSSAFFASHLFTV